ncbi:uncharacterized protein [Euphorbia lathyris]|uniref:uncharacterized protein isoform X1 n=1 Tax=Euphorbia lathyris TaxID=212925 RepID=UPI003313321B
MSICPYSDDLSIIKTNVSTIFTTYKQRSVAKKKFIGENKSEEGTNEKTIHRSLVRTETNTGFPCCNFLLNQQQALRLLHFLASFFYLFYQLSKRMLLYFSTTNLLFFNNKNLDTKMALMMKQLARQNPSLNIDVDSITALLADSTPPSNNVSNEPSNEDDDGEDNE